MAFISDAGGKQNRSPLAAAAGIATNVDPFGGGNPRTALPSGYGNNSGAPTPPTPTVPGPGSQDPWMQNVAANGQTGNNGSGGSGDGSTPPPVQYDITTDPVLQMVQAQITRSNADAQSGALSAEQQLLLNYGDPALAASVLGANDPLAAAAGQNQESELAMLKRGYTQNLQGYDENLDPSLAFSGARIQGEGRLGQAYQDQLAQAAANVQQGLAGIQSGLLNTENQNASALATAIGDAYSRAVAAAGGTPPATGSSLAAAAASDPALAGLLASLGLS